MTQHEKILQMCSDGQWHCQNQFRELYIFSPHKRREEIEKGLAKGVPWGKYKFERRKCVHDVAGQFDYRMLLNTGYARLEAKPPIPTLDDKQISLL